MNSNTLNDFDIDWDGLDEGAQDAVRLTFPGLIWCHGKSEFEEAGGFKYQGGLFFEQENPDTDIKIPGWKLSKLKGDNGDRYGLAANEATLVLIRSRRRWINENVEPTEFRHWNDYEKGFRGQMHSVGFIKGHESPVCFKFKGLVLQHLESVLAEHRAKLVSFVNTKAPKKLQDYALWVTVRAGKHFTVGSGRQTSEVTMPEIVLPKAITIDYARERYIGRELHAQAQQLYRDLNDWVAEWNYPSVKVQLATSGYPVINTKADPQKALCVEYPDDMPENLRDDEEW